MSEEVTVLSGEDPYQFVSLAIAGNPAVRIEQQLFVCGMCGAVVESKSRLLHSAWHQMTASMMGSWYCPACSFLSLAEKARCDHCGRSKPEILEMLKMR